MTTSAFRCAVTSESDAESMAGTAPTDVDWLFVEHPGPWAAKAAAQLGHLSAGHPGRVQLIRRHGGPAGPGVRVFSAVLGDTPRVRTVLLDDLDDLRDVTDPDLIAYDGPLWLVCTNGRRDVCCAERGRPIAAALARRWPEATWETTHLGGHRFAGTLLALPSATALGRLDADTAVGACADLVAGRVPADVSRGRAGWPVRAQYADLHLRAQHGWTGLDDVRLVGLDGDGVTLATPAGMTTVTVTATSGPLRRQSCADLKTKPELILSAYS